MFVFSLAYNQQYDAVLLSVGLKVSLYEAGYEGCYGDCAGGAGTNTGSVGGPSLLLMGMWGIRMGRKLGNQGLHAPVSVQSTQFP